MTTFEKLVLRALVVILYYIGNKQQWSDTRTKSACQSIENELKQNNNGL